MAASSRIPAIALYAQGAILTSVSLAVLWRPERFYEGVKAPTSSGQELAKLVKVMSALCFGLGNAFIAAGTYPPFHKRILPVMIVGRIMGAVVFAADAGLRSTALYEVAWGVVNVVALTYAS